MKLSTVKMIPAAAIAAAIMLSPAPAQRAVAAEPANSPARIVVCIDPGHQRYANLDPEPVAPDSKETKPKVAAGTRGVATKKPEYALNLEVSKLLQGKLEALGYQVVMTRDSDDVDISNRERAELANAAGAELFLRIHADGDASARTRGLSVLYPSANSAAAAIAETSKEAAKAVERAMVEETGAVSRGAIPRSDLTGFNWSKMPTILVEMGFMTNPEEDRRMSEPDYQEQLAAGMAAGTDRYLRAVHADLAEEGADRQVQLSRETPLYGAPDAAAGETARLSPQTVHATAHRGAWYRIDTWLGPLWLFNP